MSQDYFPTFRRFARTVSRTAPAIYAQITTKNLLRWSGLMAIGVVGGFVLTVGTACVVAGTAPTMSLLGRWYVEPAVMWLVKARWERVPGLRMTEDDQKFVADFALESIFALAADRFPADQDVFVDVALPLDYRPQLAGRRCRVVTSSQTTSWLEGRSPRNPILQVGPIEYRPTHLLVSAYYWPYYGHLGVSIDLHCERTELSWSCWESSR